MAMSSAPDSASLPHVVIIGAGFGGLACAKALGSSAARVTIIDRQNYHLFVPLLYQVATAALSPADIAEPIRKILRKRRNVEVVLGEVTGVDTEGKHVRLSDERTIGFDRLVVASGSSYNYFAHPEWERYAPGLKTLENALALRSRLLSAFEEAEYEPDAQRRRDLMTTIVVGGGPTGVEMAGAIAELARFTLARDFRHIDPRSARVILVEAGSRLLGSFPEGLSDYAQRSLEAMGVEIWTGRSVENIDRHTVVIEGETLAAGTVIWGAGIKASPAAQWLGVEPDRVGRVRVRDDLSVPERPGIYVIGDSAALDDPATGRPLPALAQVAAQQGQHLGKAIAREIADGAPPQAFRFRDRGNTAVIGRNAAVFDFGKRRLRGAFAWLLWAIVHVYLLVGFEKRLLVAIQWLWRYFTYQQGARLITDAPTRGPLAPSQIEEASQPPPSDL
jgi:NADH dehydrogenase